MDPLGAAILLIEADTQVQGGNLPSTFQILMPSLAIEAAERRLINTDGSTLLDTPHARPKPI